MRYPDNYLPTFRTHWACYDLEQTTIDFNGGICDITHAYDVPLLRDVHRDFGVAQHGS